MAQFGEKNSKKFGNHWGKKLVGMPVIYLHLLLLLLSPDWKRQKGVIEEKRMNEVEWFARVSGTLFHTFSAVLHSSLLLTLELEAAEVLASHQVSWCNLGCHLQHQ